MKKLTATLVISLFLASCNVLPHQNAETNSHTHTENTEQTTQTQQNPETLTTKIEKISLEKYKYLSPVLLDDKAILETEEFYLELPKAFSNSKITKSNSNYSSSHLISYSAMLNDYQFHIWKITPQHAELIKKCEKTTDDNQIYECTSNWYYVDEKYDNIVKNPKWEPFVIAGRSATPEETKNYIDIIKKSLKFHGQSKPESSINWKVVTETISLIKTQNRNNQPVLVTDEFELTLPKELKDFYFEVTDHNSYILRRGDSGMYLGIGVTRKKDFEDRKNCIKNKNCDDPQMELRSPDEFFITTLSNGDVLEFHPPFENPEEGAEKYLELLSSKTGSSLKDYVKENLTIKK